jgi:hypothetical protein
MNPTPPGYDSAAEYAREHPSTPQPNESEPLPPHHQTGNGIIYDASAQDNPTANRINTLNHWHGQINGQQVDVYAGRAKPREFWQQGMIVVEVWLPREWDLTPRPEAQRHSTQVDQYATPQQVGLVRITAVEGTKLTLATADPAVPATTFVFDLATRQWVNP